MAKLGEKWCDNSPPALDLVRNPIGFPIVQLVGFPIGSPCKIGSPYNIGSPYKIVAPFFT